MTSGHSVSGPLTLGRYTIEGEIGRGTMGVVYQAHDPLLGRRVALKTVHAHLAQDADERAAFERRFMAEARAAAGLSHPGIVVVHDVGRDPVSETLFIALEYLEGRTLAEVTRDGQARPWRQAVDWVRALAEALHHAHEHGVVHRDVKPANVMLLPSGRPKLMDFGIARMASAHLTAPGEAFGTPLYMSPEQVLGEGLDARSDVFSLGAVLHLLLTGRRAFDGPNVPAILQQVVHLEPAPPSSLAPLPAALDAVVARALAKSPERRYATARELAEDLEDVASERAPRHAAAETPPPAWASEATHDEHPLAALAAESAAARPAEATDTTRERTAPEPAAPQAALPGARPRAPVKLWERPWPWIAALACAALLASGVWLSSRAKPVPGSPPGLSLVPLRATGQLQIDFEHSLRDGVLRVFVDDELLLEQPLSSRVRRRVLVYKQRRGSLSEALAVPAGTRNLRVQVQAGDDSWSRRISGEFEPGVTRRLVGRLGGGVLGVGRELELYWAEPNPEESAAE